MRKQKPVAACVREAREQGKLTDSSVPVWQAAYEREPETVRAELRRLAASTYRPTEAGSASSLEQRTGEFLGTRPRAEVNGLLEGVPNAQATAPAAELTTTPYGNVLYGGVPTKLSDRGTRQVFYGRGWIDIAEFEQMGLEPADAALSAAAVQQIGTPEQRAALAEGPTGPLGVL